MLARTTRTASAGVVIAFALVACSQPPPPAIDAGADGAADSGAVDAASPDVPTFDAPSSDVPASDVPTFDIPTFDIPTFDIPTFDIPTFDSPSTTDAPSGSDGSHVVPDGGSGADAGAPLTDAQIAARLDAFRVGGTIDINGDGVADITVTVSGVAHTIVLRGPRGPHATLQVMDAQHASGSADLNDDGTIDYTYSHVISGSTAQEVETWDSDFDGTVDRRDTRAWTGFGTRSAQITQTVEELDPYATPPALAVVARATRGPDQNQCVADAGSDAGPPGSPGPTPCDGIDAFDLSLYDDTPGAIVDAAAPLRTGTGPWRIHIVQRNTMVSPALAGHDVGCDPSQTTQLVDAIVPALRRLLGTLDRWNTVYDLFVGHALANREWYVGCTNYCSGIPGTTTQGLQLDSAPEVTNFNGSQLAALDDVGLAEVIMHESMHFSGFGHEPRLEARGLDYVYSCARHANACRYTTLRTVSPPDEPDSAYDCARCAEPLHKMECDAHRMGLTATSLNGRCTTREMPTTNVTYCYSETTGAHSVPCECGHVRYMYCDWEELGPFDRQPWQQREPTPCTTPRWCPSDQPMVTSMCGTVDGGRVVNIGVDRPALSRCAPFPGCPD